jgi:hypothetical protein
MFTLNAESQGGAQTATVCGTHSLARVGLSVTRPQSLWQLLLEIVAAPGVSEPLRQQHLDLVRQQAMLLVEVRDCARRGEKEANAKRQASQTASRPRTQRTFKVTTSIP